MTPLAPDLSAFLQNHLPNERGASRHTIAAYAHAFTLLLRFATVRLKRSPSELAIEDLDVQLVRGFLEHVQGGRANTARSAKDGGNASCRSGKRHRPLCARGWLFGRAIVARNCS
jgi:site-specific recombinase XerC